MLFKIPSDLRNVSEANFLHKYYLSSKFYLIEVEKSNNYFYPNYFDKDKKNQIEYFYNYQIIKLAQNSQNFTLLSIKETPEVHKHRRPYYVVSNIRVKDYFGDTLTFKIKRIPGLNFTSSTISKLLKDLLIEIGPAKTVREIQLRKELNSNKSERN